MTNGIKVLTILILFSGIITAQGSFISNSAVVVDSGIYLVVEDNIVLETGSSYFKNDGIITLKNDWVNNTDSIGLYDNGSGKVVLDGANQQIRGTHSTLFKHIVLNNQSEVKSFEIDTEIDSLLEINGATLETNDKLVHLLNPSANALIWNSEGYISTNSLGGQFLRNTNTENIYTFPVGNLNLSRNYRVIELIPSSSDYSTYGASLIAESVDNVNGTSSSNVIAPFYSEDKEERIDKINTSYFHSIYEYNGSNDCKVSIYFLSDDTENLFTSVAQWKPLPNNQWENQNFEISSVTSPMPNYGMPNRVAQKSIVSNFDADIFAFVETKLFVPNGFTPNGDGINDFFEIINIEQYPNNELVILNRWGNEIYKASPYNNEWNGTANIDGIYLQAKVVTEGTYFYILKLNEDLPVLKGFLEIKGN